MQATRNGWTNARNDQNLAANRTDWLHSDIKNVATPYVHPTFEEMLSIGGFTEDNNL